ncbi:MAG TPA: TRAP transporter small permease [Candidatus Methylomirabilis sp.]|nr:TRAP transporter small permease [Candidatus Methylomirabilis sp.]HSC72272.1 TRAP transporter small permease [Candidatus Methylomirabilis sp.]
MLRALDRLLKWVLTFLIGLLTVSIFLQVLIRFVFKYPLPWTEEISRIAFVYSIFVGAAIAVREKAHLNVDFVLVLLPAGIAQVVRLIGTALVGVFLVFVTWQGVVFVQVTGVQVTPVMQVPFRYLYLIIPSSGALMLLYLVLGVLDELRQGDAG